MCLTPLVSFGICTLEPSRGQTDALPSVGVSGSHRLQLSSAGHGNETCWCELSVTSLVMFLIVSKICSSYNQKTWIWVPALTATIRVRTT